MKLRKLSNLMEAVSVMIRFSLRISSAIQHVGRQRRNPGHGISGKVFQDLVQGFYAGLAIRAFIRRLRASCRAAHKLTRATWKA